MTAKATAENYLEKAKKDRKDSLTGVILSAADEGIWPTLSALALLEKDESLEKQVKRVKARLDAGGPVGLRSSGSGSTTRHIAAFVEGVDLQVKEQGNLVLARTVFGVSRAVEIDFVNGEQTPYEQDTVTYHYNTSAEPYTPMNIVVSSSADCSPSERLTNELSWTFAGGLAEFTSSAVKQARNVLSSQRHCSSLRPDDAVRLAVECFDAVEHASTDLVNA